MTIIEVDGVNVEPLTVDSIQILAGQCYSFVLKANQPIGNYWVRAEPNVGTTGFAGGVNSAVLRYLLAPNADPMTPQPPSVNPMLEMNLRPLFNAAAPGLPGPGGADVAINLAITCDYDTPFHDERCHLRPANCASPAPDHERRSNGAVPSSVWKRLYLASEQGHRTYNSRRFYWKPSSLPSSRTFVLCRSSFVAPEVQLTTTSTQFSVMSYLRAARAIMSRSDSKQTRPMDSPLTTISHIDWHFEMGLAVVFAEDTPTVSTFNPPPSWDELCPIYDAMNPEDL
ncbi:hypothetical protein D9615_009894 [Tricholomella constricta]|uniref:Plastocyanin-like domain-containing protein n=1 Tax=Tricholomella constricta TaxID=117010 RepID=A0A8H5GZM2_9AGAR|nr:hypothetical protein D9615_009894 [Tricholomella constricta]